MEKKISQHLRVAFVSSCPESWGGSEELWAGAAQMLATDGHKVLALKTVLDPLHPKIQELRASGCTVLSLHATLALPRRLLNRLKPATQQYSVSDLEKKTLTDNLRRFQPHLTVVSQGANFDGIHFAEICAHHGHPYVLIAQKAIEFYFPWNSGQDIARRIYQAARRCFFVSRHNLVCTEDQLGMPLAHGVVVPNPFNVPAEISLPYPAPPAEAPLKLACVARLSMFDKGQDVLLRVLAQPHWQARSIEVTFYGAGCDQQGITRMAALRGVTNISFGGHVADVASIWAKHQALVLPSRSEGLPLALVEAMLCGRFAIATDVGGIAEVLEDNHTGFLAAAPTIKAFDEALERAWARRHEWEAIGAEAAHRIRTLVPADPVAAFVTQLLAAIPGEPAVGTRQRAGRGTEASAASGPGANQVTGEVWS